MKKSVLSIISVLILVVALLCVCVGCQTIGNIKDKAEEIYDDINESLKSDSNMVIGESRAHGMRLNSARIAEEDFDDYGISPLSDSAYTLTATVEPANADDKRVEWTVGVASGSNNITVSDYITLSANGLTATITCLQPFNRQFKVTVTSIDNSEVSASCTLDYVEKLTGVTVNMPQLDSPTLTGVTYTTESSIYTIKANISVQFSNFCFNTLLTECFRSELEIAADDTNSLRCLYPTYADTLLSYTDNGLHFLHSSSITALTQDCCIEGLIGCFYVLGSQHMSYHDESEVIAAFRDALYYVYEDLGTVDISISSSYNGTTYSTINKTVHIYVDGDSIHIPVTALSLSNSSLVF